MLMTGLRQYMSMTDLMQFMSMAGLSASSKQTNQLTAHYPLLNIFPPPPLAPCPLSTLQSLPPTTVAREDAAAAPVLPADAVQEVIPGNIRNADLFLRFMKQVVMYLKIKIQYGHYQVESSTPTAFQHGMSKVRVGGEGSPHAGSVWCCGRCGCCICLVTAVVVSGVVAGADAAHGHEAPEVCVHKTEQPAPGCAGKWL